MISNTPDCCTPANNIVVCYPNVDQATINYTGTISDFNRWYAIYHKLYPNVKIINHFDETETLYQVYYIKCKNLYLNNVYKKKVTKITFIECEKVTLINNECIETINLCYTAKITCINNNIKTINIQDNTTYYVNCSNNDIESLDAPYIKKIKCCNNPRLKVIKANQVTHLKYDFHINGQLIDVRTVPDSCEVIVGDQKINIANVKQYFK